MNKSEEFVKYFINISDTINPRNWREERGSFIEKLLNAEKEIESIPGIGSIVRSKQYHTPSKDGWNFEYQFIQRIADRADEEYGNEISMEDVNAILLSLADE